MQASPEPGPTPDSGLAPDSGQAPDSGPSEDFRPSPDDMAKAATEGARRLGRSGPPRQPTSPAKPRRLRYSPTYSDSRDPAPLARVLDQFVREQGWQEQSAVARLMDQWAAVVGEDVASHVQPTAFADGTLTLQAESTAWATQVRLLLPQVRKAIDEALGTGVVTKVSVLGPQAPSWVSGPRRVKGRGPRDTYG